MRPQQNAMSGVVGRMIDRKQSQAFEQWQAVVASIKVEKYGISGAISRMINRQQSQPLETWQATAAETWT